LLRAIAPVPSDTFIMSATIEAVLTLALAPSSKRGAAAARPCLAAQKLSATTATAPSMRSTWRTPLTAIAFFSSSAPPCRP
jgi:hypothetical protein